MPNLRALESGDNGWTIAYKDGATDITAAVKSNAGYTVTGKLSPGATKTITVEVTPSGASNGSKRAFDLVAFWNPQDPTGRVRDVASGEATRDTAYGGTSASTASGTMAAGLIPVPVPAPQGLYEAENASLGGGAAAANNHTGYTGSGFVPFGTAGQSATFTVDGGAGGPEAAPDPLRQRADDSENAKPVRERNEAQAAVVPGRRSCGLEQMERAVRQDAPERGQQYG
ncbi:carbohydrate-binding protein [Cohnella rhizosphaerae]|uniref:Uncharacterized protein n=1 Tax=Cohnella rhizosphaerae TaxID=1457232 RepID=A0A9X4L0E9_9BACL|nr:hypothetical protein [Cohnella rhizosphaerae]MDG0813856.1 hypothetical protein [Cohnella rhizosphaerae]